GFGFGFAGHDVLLCWGTGESIDWVLRELIGVDSWALTVQWRHYQTRYEAQQDVLDYISMFYNSRRLHSYLDYMNPNEYEQKLLGMKKAA
ncbi:MAG: hypothetical protein DIZ79_18605, partial [endosymbiont of Lamellibrachia luymesi]